MHLKSEGDGSVDNLGKSHLEESGMSVQMTEVKNLNLRPALFCLSISFQEYLDRITQPFIVNYLSSVRCDGMQFPIHSLHCSLQSLF